MKTVILNPMIIVPREFFNIMIQEYGIIINTYYSVFKLHNNNGVLHYVHTTFSHTLKLIQIIFLLFIM